MVSIAVSIATTALMLKDAGSLEFIEEKQACPLSPLTMMSLRSLWGTTLTFILGDRNTQACSN